MTGPTMTAAGAGLVGCHACGLVLRRRAPGRGHAVRCPRCGSATHARKPDSVARTWALLIAAAVLFVPANLLPVMRTEFMGQVSEDTILSGVMHLMDEDQYPLAFLVFFASIVVPVLKILGLSLLLVSAQRGWSWRARDRATLYRLIESIGRWSMLDIFVVALLAALVQIGALATILPGVGAGVFAAVVVITMLAAMTFDPRMIWDPLENHQ